MKIPAQLARFQIPEEQAKCRDVPRVWLAYAGPDKFQFVSTIMAMVVSAALPEEGQKRLAQSDSRPARDWSRAITQRELAQISGLGSRSTVTRRLVKLYSDHQAGRRILARERRFAAANRYSFGAITQSAEETNEKYHSPTAAELAAHPDTGKFWNAAPNFGTAGFKAVPRWAWDSRLPLSDTARAVFTYYCFCGLLDRGECHPRQSTVAAALGISIRTVYKANLDLAALGIIRVAHPRPQRRSDGSLCRGPARIVLLPMRALSADEAAAERARLLEAQQRRHGDSFWAQAQTLHNQLLDAWTGQDHNLNAFWKEIRRRCLLAAIPRKVVDELIPRAPD